MIVLDASVLIAYLDGEDDHHSRAETLLARQIDDDCGAVSLTLAEVLVCPCGRSDSMLCATRCATWSCGSCPFPLTALASSLICARAPT